MTDELPTAKARDASGRRDATPAPNDGKRPMGPPARERPPIPPQPGVGPSTPGRPRFPGWWSWAATLVVLLIWNLVLFMGVGAPSVAAIPYSEFISQTKAGNVASVGSSMARA